MANENTKNLSGPKSKSLAKLLERQTHGEKNQSQTIHHAIKAYEDVGWPRTPESRDDRSRREKLLKIAKDWQKNDRYTRQIICKKLMLSKYNTL